MSLEFGSWYILFLIPVAIGIVCFISNKIQIGYKGDKFLSVNRMIILVLLILAMCNISINIRTKEVSTIFLLDVSHSMKDNKDEAVNFLKKGIENVPNKNKVGIITFGEDQQVEQFLTYSKVFNDVQTSPIATATNIEDALKFAITLFPENTSKRIVLITDGKENQGEILNTSTYIQEKGIDLKIYKIEQNQIEDVYIDDIEIPENITIGDEFSIVTNIKSNVKTKAKVSIFSGREKKSENVIDIEKGSNSFLFKDIQNKGGFKPYRVVVSPDIDEVSSNNEYTAYTNVIAKPEILLIEGKSGDARGLEEVLKSIDYKYTLVKGIGAPTTLNELLEYKSIILSNVHADDLPKEFLNNIESYVKDYSGSLITTGGENSYALGGYKDSIFEKILPVNSDKQGKNEIPEIALTLVIDKSGSMLGNEGGLRLNNLTLAKEAAIKAVDNLRAIDNIGVLAFNDRFSWAVPIQKAGDKVKIQDMINSIVGNGGTSIYSAVNEAYEKQKGNNAKIKHIILLTDGQDGMGTSEYEELIEKIKKDNITLSTVSIGRDSNNELLTWLSEKCNGRNYHSDIYTDIPRIFAKEIFIATGEYLINEKFVPKVASSHEILNGIEEGGVFPELFGYVGTSNKDRATEILSSNRNEPILSSWQYGLGRCVSFTSDVNGQWSKDLLAFSKAPQFFKNIIDWSIVNYDNGGNLKITQSGNRAMVEFTSDKNDEKKSVKGIYSYEDGTNKEISLQQTLPGKYVAEVPLKDLGFYTFSVTEEKDGDVQGSYNGGFAYQYSPEYKFTQSSNALEELVSQTTGSMIKNYKDIYEGKIQNNKSKVNMTNFLLTLAMIIFLFDIAYRRLNLVKYLNKKVVIGRTSEIANNVHIKYTRIKENNEANKKTKTNKSEEQKETNEVKEELSGNRHKEKIKKNESVRLNTSELLKKKDERKQ